MGAAEEWTALAQQLCALVGVFVSKQQPFLLSYHIKAQAAAVVPLATRTRSLLRYDEWNDHRALRCINLRSSTEAGFAQGTSHEQQGSTALALAKLILRRAGHPCEATDHFLTTAPYTRIKTQRYSLKQEFLASPSPPPRTPAAFSSPPPPLAAVLPFATPPFAEASCAAFCTMHMAAQVAFFAAAAESATTPVLAPAAVASLLPSTPVASPSSAKLPGAAVSGATDAVSGATAAAATADADTDVDAAMFDAAPGDAAGDALDAGRQNVEPPDAALDCRAWLH
jgi:hypothetical protein